MSTNHSTQSIAIVNGYVLPMNDKPPIPGENSTNEKFIQMNVLTSLKKGGKHDYTKLLYFY